MSDLAPFVASLLRDRTVDDLLKENEVLRQQLRREQQRHPDRYALLTGKAGSPVYVESYITTNEPHFRQPTKVNLLGGIEGGMAEMKLTVQDFLDLELHVDWRKVLRFRNLPYQCDLLKLFTYPDQTEEEIAEGVRYLEVVQTHQRGSVVLKAFWGPFTEDEIRMVGSSCVPPVTGTEVDYDKPLIVELTPSCLESFGNKQLEVHSCDVNYGFFMSLIQTPYQPEVADCPRIETMPR